MKPSLSARSPSAAFLSESQSPSTDFPKRHNAYTRADSSNWLNPPPVDTSHIVRNWGFGPGSDYERLWMANILYFLNGYRPLQPPPRKRHPTLNWLFPDEHPSQAPIASSMKRTPRKVTRSTGLPESFPATTEYSSPTNPVIKPFSRIRTKSQVSRKPVSKILSKSPLKVPRKVVSGTTGHSTLSPSKVTFGASSSRALCSSTNRPENETATVDMEGSRPLKVSFDLGSDELSPLTSLSSAYSASSSSLSSSPSPTRKRKPNESVDDGEPTQPRRISMRKRNPTKRASEAEQSSPSSYGKKT
ncbi:hypothetical protein M422DRAFT_257766 [Sphaerobolus stellatus SS14]|uniref:Uncharacterized protein n=1 Tax=Sphaerobolus stellatus (strain SS14) TaxID=990650 RepID=A0A0C9VN79_SPHS4|nr:hypothetical protein M422DRAFT_257766 [Sphaerobolus stellatus SS14]